MNNRDSYQLLKSIRDINHKSEDLNIFSKNKDVIRNTLWINFDVFLKDTFTNRRDLLQEKMNKNPFYNIRKADEWISKQYTRTIGTSTAFVPIQDWQKSSFSHWNNPHSLYQMAFCNSYKQFLVPNHEIFKKATYNEKVSIRKKWIKNSLDDVTKIDMNFMKKLWIRTPKKSNEERLDNALIIEKDLQDILPQFRNRMSYVSKRSSQWNWKKQKSNLSRNIAFTYKKTKEIWFNWFPKFECKIHSR